MYSWKDRDGTNLTLRPELTAPVVRSFIQHSLGTAAPLQRLYYIGPSFRRERPQKGRQRQFHQFGVEAFGSGNPEQDAEVIAMAWHILSQLGISESSALQLNSIGSPDCRMAYRETLKEFIRPNLDQFSETSQKRFETNPLRILDTKATHEKKMLEGAPSVSDCYTDEDKWHFESVQDFLNAMDIPFTLNPRLVRGLDYYTRTVFEFTSKTLGAQDALLGGGRYDGLVETLGGKATPGIGFAAGMERFIMVMEEIGQKSGESKNDIYFVCLNKEGLSDALSLSNELRQAGYSVISDPLRRSMKAQMREANKSGARFALILGETEREQKSIQVKDLKNGEQISVAQSDLIHHFQHLTK
jgi:histidyl-tRNA synthetase